MKILKMISLLALVSCSVTATHVNKPTVPKYAPKGYIAKGVIKYKVQGPEFAVRMSRNSAFKKMYKECKGKYKIISEGDRMEGTTVTPIAGSLVASSSQYWYISYQCITKRKRRSSKRDRD